MLTLGIESSCDETAIALVKDGSMIAQAMYSQATLHALFGGVVPELASRKHYEAIAHCVDEVFSDIEYTLHDVDCIAVARGPGLLGSLLVGIAFAKGLAFALQKPLVGVNHLHAHLFASGMEYELALPSLGILLSGGHTYTYYITSYADCTILGRTLDDAVGEVFDKVGKMLGMSYPAGKTIEQFALKGEMQALFTPPYCKENTLDYSFSGLKTQLLHYIRANPECVLAHHTMTPDENMHCAMVCASLTHAVTYSITHKVTLTLQHCMKECLQCESLLLGGGVVANSFIRKALCDIGQKHGYMLSIPSPALCTDNAYMIAYLGACLYNEGYYHSSNLTPIPRGRTIPWDYHKQRDAT